MGMEIPPRRHRPWPDLPDPLLENILERLPISAYVRFSAVCRRWRSVQAAHRRRHSPSPPPMLRLPWIARSDQESAEEITISCYSPFEDRLFTIPLPHLSFCFPYSDRGWFFNFTSKSSGDFFLWNPISGQKIESPRGPHRRPSPCLGAQIVSPPPSYIVSFVGISSIFLFRWFDPRWVELQPPPGLGLFNRALFCGGKYYCICSPRSRLEESHSHDLLVADPLAAHPSFQYFEMAAADTWRWRGVARLVEFDEQPLLVMETHKYVNGRQSTDSVGIGLYRLDLGRRMWVEVESIGGDRVLVLAWFHSPRSVSFLASDVGARGNCVYFLMQTTGAKPRWKMFDLGTGSVTDFLPPNASQFMNNYRLFFVPSLC